MRLTLLSIALVVVIAFMANAQPGYYINASGDTIKTNLSLQKKLNFIDKIIISDGSILAPKDISGFGVNGIHYVVKKVSLDKTPKGGFVTDTVFLEVMSRAKMSLFYMIDENDKAHFYIENENGPQELTVRLSNDNNGVMTSKLEVYKSVLKGIFPACTDLFPAIDKTVFDKKGIQTIYGKLYQCRFKEEAVVTKSTDKSNEFGVLAGVSISLLDVPYDFNSPASVLTFPNSITPTAGVFFETALKNRGFGIRHELTYRALQSTSNEYRSSPFASSYTVGTISAKYIKYSIVVRRYFLKGNLQPYVNVGLSPAYAVATNSTTQIKDGPYNDAPKPMFNNVSKIDFGYFLGGGVRYNSFALDLRYEASSNPRPKEKSLTWIRSIYFTLSYRLIKT